MSFPKKGKFFPKRGDPNSSNGDGGSLDGTMNFALEIAAALERTLRDRNTRIKTVAGWTGANERTVRKLALRAIWSSRVALGRIDRAFG